MLVFLSPTHRGLGDPTFEMLLLHRAVVPGKAMPTERDAAEVNYVPEYSKKLFSVSSMRTVASAAGLSKAEISGADSNS